MTKMFAGRDPSKPLTMQSASSGSDRQKLTPYAMGLMRENSAKSSVTAATPSVSTSLGTSRTPRRPGVASTMLTGSGGTAATSVGTKKLLGS